MKEWIGKKCTVFVRNLSERAIVYSGKIISIDENFITFLDKYGERIYININDIIQIKGMEAEGEGAKANLPQSD